MEQYIFDSLKTFNQLYKEMDEIYHLYARKHDISDSTLWLLYSLCENDTVYTQKQLCDAWHSPPQTINSALKGLEKRGIIRLEPVPGNHKNKRIVLTKRGKEIADQVVSPLIFAEQSVLKSMTEKERADLLSLTQKYVELFQTAVG